MARVTKDIAAFKRVYRKTGTLRSAALAAGYSPNCSSTGMQHLPKAIRTYVLTRQKKLSKLAQLAREITPEQQEMTVRGALLANVAAGKDQAVNSLKLLGQDRTVNMFTPDQQLGIVNVVLQNKPDSVPVLELPPEE